MIPFIIIRMPSEVKKQNEMSSVQGMWVKQKIIMKEKERRGQKQYLNHSVNVTLGYFTWRQNKWTLKEVIASNIFRILNQTKSCAWRNFFGSRHRLLLLLFPCWNTTPGKKRLKKLDLRQGIKDAQGSSSVTHFYTLHHLAGKEESFSFLLMLSWFKGWKWMTDHTSLFSSSFIITRLEKMTMRRKKKWSSPSRHYTIFFTVLVLKIYLAWWPKGSEVTDIEMTEKNVIQAEKIEEGRWSGNEISYIKNIKSQRDKRKEERMIRRRELCE